MFDGNLLDSNFFAPFRGHITGKIEDLDGNLLETFESHVDGEIQNLVVRRSAIVLASCLRPGANQSVISHMAIGTSTTPPVVANTSLVTETARIVPTFSFVQDDTTISFNDGTETLTNKLMVTGIFGATVSGDLTEVGLFADGTAAAGSGLLICRKVFPAWSKSVDTNLTLQWVLSF